MQNEGAKEQRYEISCSTLFADDVDYFCYEECVALSPRRLRPFRRNHWRLPTDPALIALDAKFVLRTPKGERVVDAEDYLIGPEIDITRLHICSSAICLLPFGFHPPGRARNSILKKCGTATDVASVMVQSGSAIERMQIAVKVPLVDH
jgi:hypothetical protein